MVRETRQTGSDFSLGEQRYTNGYKARFKRVEIELSSEVYMASRDYRTASVAGLSALETNKVLKNTYLLLSATLGFSALMAGVSMAMGIGPLAPT